MIAVNLQINLLPQNQHRFRAGRSTMSAIQQEWAENTKKLKVNNSNHEIAPQKWLRKKIPPQEYDPQSPGTESQCAANVLYWHPYWSLLLLSI